MSVMQNTMIIGISNYCCSCAFCAGWAVGYSCNVSGVALPSQLNLLLPRTDKLKGMSPSLSSTRHTFPLVSTWYGIPISPSLSPTKTHLSFGVNMIWISHVSFPISYKNTPCLLYIATWYVSPFPMIDRNWTCLLLLGSYRKAWEWS